jgi:signal transduction histidine kinase
MSYLSGPEGESKVSLEWAAMLVGVIAIFGSTYLIFGTDWNAYRVTNLILGVSFVVFITYSFLNSKNLSKDLAMYRRKANHLENELEKAQNHQAQAELESKEKALQINNLNSDIEELNVNLNRIEEALRNCKKENISSDL